MENVWETDEKYQSINQALWGRRMGAREYFMAISSNVKDKVIVKYVERQSQEPPGGNLKIDVSFSRVPAETKATGSSSR